MLVSYFYQSLGFFIYPFGVCFVLGLFLIMERSLFLRSRHIFPRTIQRQLINGDFERSLPGGESTAENIIDFSVKNNPDKETLYAYTRCEVMKLERGIFVLEIITAVAPLIGLLGTVLGLVQIFASNNYAAAIDPDALVKGIGLALSTTVVGLVIAIPTLAFHGYFSRKIELYAQKLELLCQRLLNINGTSV